LKSFVDPVDAMGQSATKGIEFADNDGTGGLVSKNAVSTSVSAGCMLERDSRSVVSN